MGASVGFGDHKEGVHTREEQRNICERLGLVLR